MIRNSLRNINDKGRKGKRWEARNGKFEVRGSKFKVRSGNIATLRPLCFVLRPLYFVLRTSPFVLSYMTFVLPPLFLGQFLPTLPTPLTHTFNPSLRSGHAFNFSAEG